MICILGKTASGKDLIVNKLCQNGYKKIITYTTRPIREGEEQDGTYHFITDEEFSRMENGNLFIESSSYHTAFGKWNYGSAKNDYIKADNKTIIILPPKSYTKILKLEIPITSIYIYANTQTIKKRLQKRGDSKEEIDRRLKSDNDDFCGIENLVDKIFYNNLKNNIDDVVQKIVNYLERVKV